MKADATTEATSSKTVGAVYEDVADNATGYVVTGGEVDNLDTSAYTIGQQLWLGTTPGAVVTTPPAEPNHVVFIGTVTRAQNGNGRILYHIQNGYELNELHGVSVPSPSANDYFYYNGTTQLWESRQFTADKITDSNLVGQNIIKLTNPSQVSYLRINANNTVDALTISQLKSDLGLSKTVLSSNVTNSDATGAFQDVTGLSFSVVSGATYSFKFVIIYSVNNVTTGSKWSINGPAFTSLGYRVTYPSTSQTAVINNSPNAYDNGTATTATPLTAGNIAIIEGIIRPSASGTLIARSACEIVAGATVTATIGSYVDFQQLL